jgi:hypothetical protein
VVREIALGLVAVAATAAGAQAAILVQQFDVP